MNKQRMKRIWQGFWQLADPKIWIASTVPFGVGTVYAFRQTGNIAPYWIVISLIALYLLEIGKNGVNEIIDFWSGVDCYVSEEERTPFSGGKKTIVDNKLTVSEVAVISVLTVGLGCLIGIYIVWVRELRVLWVGIVGVLLALAYSLPPFKLAYRGLGELTVAVTFGPLIVTGAYLVQASYFSLQIILLSVPIGLLIANVLWFNQYPDYEADRKGNKRNWVVRLGKKKATYVYGFIYLLTYVSFITLAIVFNSLFWLLPLVSIPLAGEAVDTARKYHDDLSRLLKANLRTIQVYQLTGITMVAAALLEKFLG